MVRPVFAIALFMRPWTVNTQRNLHPMKTAKLVKLWRTEAREASVGAELIQRPVDVVVDLYLKGQRSQDCGACYPAVKAAIDGIVDAGVLVDDTPEYVRSIRMNAPVLRSGNDMMVVSLYD